VVAITALMATGCAYARQVSQPAPGTQNGVYGRVAASADGRFIAYASERESNVDAGSGVHVLDASLNQRELVSVSSAEEPAEDWSGEPAISADGRYVAFESDAANLVPGDENGVTDIFVRDRTAGTTTRVSTDAAGVEADDNSYNASISADGRYVAFTSDSDSLHPQDNNGASDIYVKDRTNGALILASVSGLGQTDFGAWDGVISGNGRYVAFTTDTPLIATDENWDNDVYVRNIAANTTAWVSRPKVGNPEGGTGESPSINFDGRVIAFSSFSTDLDNAASDTNGADVFVRDLNAGVTTRVSVGPGGGLLPAQSFLPTISADGTRVAFTSLANASGTDTNGAVSDLYVRDLLRGRTVLLSTNPDLIQTSSPVFGGTMSGNGRYGLWASLGKYHTDDKNSVADVYFRSVDVPNITSITPSTVARGASISITINGDTFLPGAQAFAVDGLTVSNVVVVNENKMTAQVSAAANLAPGTYPLFVTNMGTGPGPNTGATDRCDGCIRVT
jgi:Tol biopolymer transport system component